MTSTTKLIGKVVKGRGVGTKLGFPTLNFEVNKMPEFTGVFAGTVEILGENYSAAIFIGKPKTFNYDVEVVEAHLLDFDGNINSDTEGKIIIKEKIRDVEKFENSEELKKAIAQDLEKIKQFSNFKFKI